MPLLSGRITAASPPDARSKSAAKRSSYPIATGSFLIYTSALTLFFLRTHTAAYRRERRCLFKHPGRLTEFATLYILYESGDVDSHRATGDTLRVGTVHASGSLDYGGFRGKSTVDFLIACNTVSRIKFRHLHTRNRRALLGRAGLAQILAPQGVTRRYGCRHIIFLLVI